MKFAEITTSSQKEAFGLSKFFLKFPDFIIHWYLSRHPFSIQETNLENVKGYHVTIYPQAENMEKLLLKLQQKEVDILLTDCDIDFPSIIDISYGNIIHSLLILEAAKKAMKRQSKTLQYSKFLIVDGEENFITNIVLDSLYPFVNYLSIYTKRPEYFLQKAEEIYEEYGLRLELFSDTRLFQPFNIIINCSHNMENYDYKIQKNAFFFDVAQNKQKMQHLMARRNDLLLSNGLLLKWNNKTYLSKQIEVLLRITERSFYEFLKQDYHKETLIKITNLLQQKEIKVAALTCFEKRI